VPHATAAAYTAFSLSACPALQVVDDSKNRLQRTSSVCTVDGVAVAAAAATAATAAAAGRPDTERRLSYKEASPPADGSAANISISAGGRASSTGSTLGQPFSRSATASILYPDVAAFAAAGIASGADCYDTRPGDQQQQQLYRARSEFGESMATDATWLTDVGQSAAASILTATLTGISRCSTRGWDNSIEGSCAWGSEFETVFHMTGGPTARLAVGPVQQAALQLAAQGLKTCVCMCLLSCCLLCVAGHLLVPCSASTVSELFFSHIAAVAAGACRPDRFLHDDGTRCAAAAVGSAAAPA
jgi:hypothetical protein